MDSAQQQLVDKLKTTNNVLVTVSRNPSVDQLAALLGLTLLLNKLGKHAAAVFSGEVPSTLEFLQPEDTIEKNTDSLRDFIIALDKSKADKLRYKVEDDVVRIFITPYKTSISQADLEFSQGDFNVDLVVALGVQAQEDLDDAITAHGRILHDATVASINLSPEGGLGSISLHDPQASSLSEIVTDLSKALEVTLDGQIATALLTGIVAETDRFSNDKTSAQTMSASALLMAAGANQQLVAAKLEEPPQPKDDDDTGGQPAADSSDDAPKTDDGTLQIEHAGDEDEEESSTEETPASDEPSADTAPTGEAKSDEPAPDFELPTPQLSSEPDEPEPASESSRIVIEPPSRGNPAFNSNSQPDQLEPSTDPHSTHSSDDSSVLNRISGPSTAAEPVIQPDTPNPAANPVIDADEPADKTDTTPDQPSWMPPGATEEPTAPSAPAAVEPAALAAEPVIETTPEAATPPAPTESPAANDQDNQTLTQIEASVNSPHLNQARDEVSRALNDGPANTPLPPIEALNAQPLGDNLHAGVPAATPAPEPSAAPVDPASFVGPAPDPITSTQPSQPATTAPVVIDPTAPPPVPPPMPFQFGPAPSNQQNQQ